MDDSAMTENADRIAIADQAQAAYERFLSPAFAVCREEYAAKLTKLYATVEDAKGERVRTKLALAIRVLDEVEQQIKAVIVGGDVARHEQRGVDKIASLPAYKKFGVA